MLLSSIICGGWKQPLITCKCMKAAAVRNINSRETTEWLFVSVWWWYGSVFMGILWSDYIHFFLFLHVCDCVNLCMDSNQFTCMQSNTSALAGGSGGMCSIDVRLYSSSFINHLSVRFPLKTTGVLTGRSHSIPEPVTHLLTVHTMPSAQLSYWPANNEKWQPRTTLCSATALELSHHAK